VLVKQTTVRVAALILGAHPDDVQAALQKEECYPCGWFVTGTFTVEHCYPMGAILAAGERLVKQGLVKHAAMRRLEASVPR
jgi:hypothetical protein